MKQYKPSHDELYTEKPCPICGIDILDDRETCSPLCEVQWECFKEDFEESIKDYFYLTED